MEDERFNSTRAEDEDALIESGYGVSHKRPAPAAWSQYVKNDKLTRPLGDTECRKLQEHWSKKGMTMNEIYKRVLLRIVSVDNEDPVCPRLTLRYKGSPISGFFGYSLMIRFDNIVPDLPEWKQRLSSKKIASLKAAQLYLAQYAQLNHAVIG